MSEVDKEEDQGFHQKWLEVEQENLAQEYSTQQDTPKADSIQPETKRSRTTRKNKKTYTKDLSTDEDLEGNDDNMSSYSNGEKTKTSKK